MPELPEMTQLPKEAMPHGQLQSRPEAGSRNGRNTRKRLSKDCGNRKAEDPVSCALRSDENNPMFDGCQRVLAAVLR